MVYQSGYRKGDKETYPVIKEAWRTQMRRSPKSFMITKDAASARITRKPKYITKEVKEHQRSWTGNQTDNTMTSRKGGWKLKAI